MRDIAFGSILFAIAAFAALLWAMRGRRPGPAVALEILVIDDWGDEVFETTEEGTTMALILKKGQSRVLRIRPIDAEGATTSLDGAARWSTATPGDYALEPLDDVSVKITAVTANVSGVINVEGDGVHGEGEELIHGTLEVTTLPTDAVGIAIQVDPETAPPAVDPETEPQGGVTNAQRDPALG